jgi:hypothetical protein
MTIIALEIPELGERKRIARLIAASSILFSLAIVAVAAVLALVA